LSYKLYSNKLSGGIAYRVNKICICNWTWSCTQRY